MASNLKGLPPLPTLQTPLINEPDSVSQDQSLQHHAKITHTGSMPVISLQPQHPLRKSKRQTLINAQLTKLHKSNIDLNEIKRKDIAILNHQSPQDSPLPSPDVIKKPEWLKTAPEIQPQGKLPRGASFVFATELSALETELKSAKMDLKTWGEVQAKALESLVCANKDLKSYKPPKPPVSPQDATAAAGKPGTGAGRNTASGKKAPPPPKSASKSLKASPTKSGKTGSKGNLTKKPSMIKLAIGKDPRTGIVIGEENCNLLAAKAAAAAVSAPPVLDGTLTLVVPNTPPPPPPPKPEPERWPEALYDGNFKVTPMYISETIYRLAPDDETLEKFRESSINKSDWVAKVVKERTQHLQKIEELEKRVAIAARDMEWVNTHRMYGKSKSMMVSTVFSDYSHEKGLKIPVLGAPEASVPISDLELLQMGAPTSGIFNQVRNVMITRTDNGLQDIWLMKKNISDNFEVPGILEVEAAEQLADSLGSTPVGALEPKKVVIQKPKNSMHPFHERDMELLKKMRSRVNYLRNPRFPYQVPNECIGILRDDVIQIEGGEHKLSPEEFASKALRSIGGGIVALPSSIHFADYQPNQTYSKTLIIKNRSPYSARFRLSIPPPFEYSPFFSVTMISTPSDGDGLVAPGMGCQYRVDFTPNTLANFQQVLVVYTELGTNLPGISFEPFSVQLSGTRAAPELTMPDVLHCGPCRDGFVAIRKWKFKNVGGSGRFMILGANDETDVAQIFADIGSYNTEAEYQAAIADKTNESSRARTFSQDAFEIFPSYFSLLTGEYEEITVKFFPEPMEQDDTSTKKVETILRIACDNCQVLELPVRANVQKPSVSITACNPVHMQALDEQAWDVEGVKFQFGNQNLQATTSLQLTLKNQSRLKLPFIWVPVDNPGFHSEAKRNYTVSTISGNGTVSDSLKFTPASGAFTPNGEITFQVSFTPTRAKKYDIIGRLLLLEEGDHVQVNEDGTLVPIKSGRVFEQECVLEIFCTGTGLEYNVQVKPELILVPSPIHAGHSKNTEIRIVNNSIAPVSYEWSIEGIDPEVANIAISVPEASKVDPNEDLKFLVSIIGVFPGTIDGSLICKTAGQTGPLIKVPIRGTVDLKPGDLDFSVPIVDFGLLALGTSANATVPLINKSTLPLYYKLVAHSTQPKGANEKMPQGKGILTDPWHLNISSSEGMLNPGEKIDIHFTFIPIWYQSFRGRLSCEIAQSSESSKAILVTGLDMCAEVQTPYAIIQHSENAVACYVNEPFMWKVTIENKRMLQTKFVWKQPQDETEVKVHFEPSSADLGPGEKIDVNITLTYSEIGLDQFSEFHCAVEGMIENGGIMKAKIKTDVLGLSINLKFPKDDEKILNFGNECPIFESRTRSFVIENLSAIASSYRLWVETFTAVGVDKLELENEKTSVKKRLDAGNYILKPTEKPKLGFSSETGKKWLDNVTEVRKTIQRMNQVLQEGRGAAFHPSPSFGTLPPFGRVKITITSYNNLVGLYNDKLVCEVGPWLRETIPITLGVDGIPVKFSGAQLVLSKSHSKIERINFGTQIAQHGIRMPLPPFGSEFYNNGRKSVFARFMNHGHGTSEIDGTAMSNVNAEPATINKKEFQVENQSPRTICLRWNVFVKRQSLTSVVAQKNAGTTPSTSEVDQLLLDELVNNDPMTSAVVVQPSPMFIPAFKTLPARISFCAKDTGFYKALLVADVGYVQPDGSISFSPMGVSDDDSFYDNSSFERNLLAPLKKLEAENEHFPEGLTLPRIRKVRLLVQGKAIEPKLVFDDVIAKEDGVEQKESAVWFKKVRDEEILELDRQRKQKLQELEVQRIQYEKDISEKTKNAILAQHKNSVSVFIMSDTRNPALNDKYFQIVHEETPSEEISSSNTQFSQFDEIPSTSITLKNTTETLCSFSINVSPCEVFKVTKVEKPQTPTPRIQKPVSSNTNRAVTSIKTPAEGLGRASQSQSQSRRTSRTSRVSKDIEHKLPFTAPTTAALSATSPSKASVISLRNSSSKKSKTPALGDEVDDIPAGTVYELNPGETVRIDIECLDREILKTTTVEDNVSTNPSYIQSRASRPTDDLLDASSSDNAAESAIFLFNESESGRQNAEYAKGHLKVVFTNGSVQTIPILCED